MERLEDCSIDIFLKPAVEQALNCSGVVVNPADWQGTLQQITAIELSTTKCIIKNPLQ
jgi:hypothetical protein